MPGISLTPKAVAWAEDEQHQPAPDKAKIVEPVAVAVAISQAEREPAPAHGTPITPTISCDFSSDDPLGLDLFDGPASYVLLKSKGVGQAAAFDLRPNDVLTTIRYMSAHGEQMSFPRSVCHAMATLTLAGRPVTLVFERASQLSPQQRLMYLGEKTPATVSSTLEGCLEKIRLGPYTVGAFFSLVLYGGIYLLITGIRNVPDEETTAQHKNRMVWGAVLLAVVLLCTPLMARVCGFCIYEGQLTQNPCAKMCAMMLCCPCYAFFVANSNNTDEPRNRRRRKRGQRQQQERRRRQQQERRRQERRRRGR